MHRSGHDITRQSASMLLAVFLMGGLLAPVVHRVHHGQIWAKLHTDVPETCDHTQHSDSFESTAPDFLDDDCLLCIRHLVDFDGAQTAQAVHYDVAGYALPPQSAPELPHFTLLPIRGPPGVS